MWLRFAEWAGGGPRGSREVCDEEPACAFGGDVELTAVAAADVAAAAAAEAATESCGGVEDGVAAKPGKFGGGAPFASKDWGGARGGSNC